MTKPVNSSNFNNFIQNQQNQKLVAETKTNNYPADDFQSSTSKSKQESWLKRNYGKLIAGAVVVIFASAFFIKKIVFKNGTIQNGVNKNVDKIKDTAETAVEKIKDDGKKIINNVEEKVVVPKIDDNSKNYHGLGISRESFNSILINDHFWGLDEHWQKFQSNFNGDVNKIIDELTKDPHPYQGNIFNEAARDGRETIFETFADMYKNPKDFAYKLLEVKGEHPLHSPRSEREMGIYKVFGDMFEDKNEFADYVLKAKNNDGENPIHSLIKEKIINQIEEPLSYVISCANDKTKFAYDLLNAKDNKGLSALNVACAKRQSEVFHILANNTNDPDKFINTAMKDIAEANSFESNSSKWFDKFLGNIVDLFKNKSDLVEIVKNHKLDDKGETMFHRMAKTDKDGYYANISKLFDTKKDFLEFITTHEQKIGNVTYVEDSPAEILSKADPEKFLKEFDECKDNEFVKKVAKEVKDSKDYMDLGISRWDYMKNLLNHDNELIEKIKTKFDNNPNKIADALCSNHCNNNEELNIFNVCAAQGKPELFNTIANLFGDKKEFAYKLNALSTQNPLMTAGNYKKPQMYKVIGDMFEDKNEFAEYVLKAKRHPLHYSLETGDTEALKYVLSGAKDKTKFAYDLLNAKNTNGDSALTWAYYCKRFEPFTILAKSTDNPTEFINKAMDDIAQKYINNKEKLDHIATTREKLLESVK